MRCTESTPRGLPVTVVLALAGVYVAAAAIAFAIDELDARRRTRREAVREPGLDEHLLELTRKELRV
jgi:hypothetical protein